MTESPFRDFPKHRPELPLPYKAIHDTAYAENRQGATPMSSVSQRVESWMHRRIAADVSPGTSTDTLEIGAGTLNHLRYELSAKYDAVEPEPKFYRGSPYLKHVRALYADIREVPVRQTYDRIISIAAFEHLGDLPFVVARAATLLKDGGCLRVAIPSEGTPLWKLGWMLTTGIEFRMRHGLDYGVIMRYEHINTAREIRDVLRYFFSAVESAVFGLAPVLSLYQFFNCRSPRLDRCTGYLLAHGADWTALNT